MSLYELMVPPDEPDDKVFIGPNDWGILLDKHFMVNSEISFSKIDTPIVELSEDHIRIGFGKRIAKQYWMSINRLKYNNSNHKQVIDVFDLIINGEKPDIPITLGKEVKKQRLFSCRPRANKLDRDLLAFTMPNKNAYGFRCAQQGVVDAMKNHSLNNNVFRSFKPSLVTVAGLFPKKLNDDVRFQEIGFTPRTHLETMILNAGATINAYVEVAQSKGFTNIPVYFFINQGEKSGASQPRLHFQTIINFDYAGHEINLESSIQGFITDNCRMCQSTHVDDATGKSRLLYRNQYFDLWLASTPKCDYHLKFAPRRHVQRLTDLTVDEIKGLADILKFSDLVLTRSGVTKHRNVNFLSLPYGYDTPEYHFHGDILPVQYFGALERCYAISVAYVSPLDAYKDLKESQLVVEDIGLNNYDYDY